MFWNRTFPHDDLIHVCAAFDIDMCTDMTVSKAMANLTKEECEAFAHWAERLGLDLLALNTQVLVLPRLAATFR